MNEIIYTVTTLFDEDKESAATGAKQGTVVQLLVPPMKPLFLQYNKIESVVGIGEGSEHVLACEKEKEKKKKKPREERW